jgi:8-oxo-dGTP pyrophosphatase MutT (NUDIX family)
VSIEQHDSPQSWRAAVVLVRRRGKVLAVTRGGDMHNWNLPGGNRELGDSSAAATARRELQEETGLYARRLRPIASWISERGGLVVAFEDQGVEGELRSSREGKAAWVSPRLLTTTRSTYHRHNKALLETPPRRGRKGKS